MEIQPSERHEKTNKSFLRDHTGRVGSQNWPARALIFSGILFLSFSAVALQLLPTLDKLGTSLFSAQTPSESEGELLESKMSGKRNVGYFVSSAMSPQQRMSSLLSTG